MKLNKNQKIGVFVALVVVGFFFIYGDIVNLFINNSSNSLQKTSNTTNDKKPAGLLVKDVKVGNGAEAVNGKLVTVNYVGTLSNGTKFDASADHGAPFQFVLGVGQVIRGWDLGVVGMKVGGVRELTIPPSLAYGANAIGPIPANSTLKFSVELIAVEDVAMIDQYEVNPNQ